MTKDELRRKIQRELSTMSEAAYESANSAIAERVQAIPEWRDASVVLGYLAMRREASVDILLAAAIAAGKYVAVPTVTEGGILFRELESAEGPFVHGAFGIREPLPEAPTVNVAQLTDGVLFVPGLGFDRSGSRLGRGGGYYDRLLADLPQTVVAVGIAFAAQLQPRIPTDSHDKRIDLLATDQALYRF